MQAGQVVFKDLLISDSQYRIPLFQRTYDWREPQWERLWEDLQAIYVMDEPRSHFIGSVVAQPVPTIPGRVSQYVLIDGQQRMTTLLILLSAIRDKARQESEMWPRLADEIQDLYLTNQYKSGDEKPKLVPSKRDRAPFLAIVESETPPADSRVGRARGYFDAKLSAGGAIDLVKLKVRVTDCLDMVSVMLEPDDNPNRIFESLNYTGLSLSAADLIRNYLFMNIRDPYKQDAAYEKHWYPMQEELARAKNVDRQTMFFWRYLMMDGSLPKRERGEIFERIKREIGGDADDESIIKALRRFEEFSGYYLQVVASSMYGKHKGVTKQINRLRRWGLDISYSFLMKALSHVESGDIAPSDLEDVARMLESLAVRRHALGYNQTGLRALFARMCANVDFENDFVESTRRHLLRQGWRGWPNDDAFIRGLAGRRLYVPSRLARTRLILDTLELKMTTEEAVDMSNEKITIEHIMPQKLTREWRNALGPDADEIHARWLHTLGNLTLALNARNSKMSDKPFLEKKTVLEKSNFALNSSLKDLDEWNAETIERRGRKLAELAAKHWTR